MNVLIIEDEPAAARRLKNMLAAIDPSMTFMEVIDSIEDAVDFLKTHHHPDLIFADIQLSDGVCFEIFKQVQPSSPVVFTTAYDEYAVEAFKVNSIDYLLKPIHPEELKKSIDKFNHLKITFGGSDREKLETLLKLLDKNEKHYKTRFLVKSGQSMKPLSIEDIAYFTIDNQLVFVIDRTGKRYLIESSLDDIEKMIDPKVFFRINRQMIISLGCVKTIHPYFNSRLKLDLVPEIKSEVIVSRMKVNDFKEWLEE